MISVLRASINTIFFIIIVLILGAAIDGQAEKCSEKDSPHCNATGIGVGTGSLPPLENNGLDEDGKYTYYNEYTQNVLLTQPKQGELLPLVWPNGEKIKDNIFRVGLPKTLRTELIKYAERVGLYDLIESIYSGNTLNIGTEEYVNLPRSGEMWHNKRPPGEWSSNMHWISPGNKEAHDGFLRALGDGGTDEILNSIGRELNLDGISCYHLTFIVVTECDQGYVHHDFNNTGVKAFNLIVPMDLVPGSEPELDVVDFKRNVGRFKYEKDVGLLIGDGALHATASTHYSSGFRLMATIFLADVNQDNIDYMEYSQPYPPDDPSERLRNAGEHWKPDGSTSLPRNIHSKDSPSDGQLLNKLENAAVANFEKLKQTNSALMSQIESLRAQNEALMHALEEIVSLTMN